jgi:hypothetical protein
MPGSVPFVAAVMGALVFAAAADAQTVAAGRDVCGMAWFSDGVARDEYTRLSTVLGRTARHQAAVKAAAEASEALLRRLAALQRQDLITERVAADQAAQAATRSGALAATQTDLSSYCLGRLKRAPDSFTEAIATHTARARRFAAMPDNQLLVAFRSDTEQIRRDFGTPADAARTLRIVLRSAGP